MPVIHSVLHSDVEPLTDEEREALIAEWPWRIVGRLTSEQRKTFRRLLLKKREPKKKRGGQLRWDTHKLTVLREIYESYRNNAKFKHNEAIEMLTKSFELSSKTIKNRLSEANKLPNKSHK